MIVLEFVVATSALLSLVIVGLVIERRTAREIGLAGPDAPRRLAEGFLVGAVVISVVIGILAAVGGYRIMGIGSVADGRAGLSSAVMSSLLLFLVISIFE